MFCPRCGKKLKLLEQTPFEEIDDWWDLPDKEMEDYLKKYKYHVHCKRDEYECINKDCNLHDTVFYHHHPFNGINAAPGDSWSLSWIK